MVMRWAKKCGHAPIALLGGATTRIGNPTGKSTSRPIISDDIIVQNEMGITRVFDRVLGHVEIRNNSEWFDKMSFQDTMNLFRNFPMGRILALDTVKSRLERNDPLSLMEVSYSAMQAWDFAHLNQHHDVDIQIGGSDQWGNIVSGVHLVKRLSGKRVWGLTTPLFTNSMGEKMGKTSSGAIWLDSSLLSVWDFWQFWRNISDSLVASSLRRFTEIPIGEIDEMLSDINLAKIRLANAVTEIVHGSEEAAIAAERANDAFSRGGSTETHALENGEFFLIDIMMRFNFVKSRNEARRLLEGNAIRINSTPVLGDFLIIKNDEEIRLEIGKKRKISLV
jgi:tyrosyl-tRNA synthetase